MKLIRVIISRLLISVGLAMVALSVAYEVYDYPWGMIWNTSSEQTDDLPEPGPPLHLPDYVEIVPYDKTMEQTKEAESETTPVMPAADTLINPAKEIIEEPMPVMSEADTEFPSTKQVQSTNNVTKVENLPKVQYVLLGVFKIPKLNVSVNLLDGSNEEMLAGVGHVKGTAMPGEEGNAVFSGHRSYIRMHPFRHLDKLQSGDKILIAFDGHDYTYVVTEQFFVNPDETWVMQTTEEETHAITLITCDPKINPTRRLIVRGKLSLIDGITREDHFTNQLPQPSKEDLSSQNKTSGDS